VAARPILSHSCLPAINLNLDVRDKNCVIQNGNLSLIRNPKVTVFSQQLLQPGETTGFSQSRSRVNSRTQPKPKQLAWQGYTSANRALFEQAIFYSSDWQGLHLDKSFL